MALMRFHRRWQRRPTQSYRLVVTTSDLARQRSLDLPWDLEPVTLRSKFAIKRACAGETRDPENLDRSIFAKPRGVRWTEFDLTPEQQLARRSMPSLVMA